MLGVVWLAVEDELLELVFEQFVLGLKAGDEAEDLLQDFTDGDAAIHPGGASEFFEIEKFLGFVEQVGVHVFGGLVPLLGLDLLFERRIVLDLILEFLEEHAVDLHAQRADLLGHHAEYFVGARTLVGADGRWCGGSGPSPPVPVRGRGSLMTSS